MSYSLEYVISQWLCGFMFGIGVASVAWTQLMNRDAKEYSLLIDSQHKRICELMGIEDGDQT